MADSFGLQQALKRAKSAGVAVPDLPEFEEVIDELEELHEKEEELQRRFVALERQINRGEGPDVASFTKLSDKCARLSTDVRKKCVALESSFARARKDDRSKGKQERRAAKDAANDKDAKDKAKDGGAGEKNAAKLFDDIEAKLDKALAFLVKQSRRPDTGELLLHLLSRRGESSGADEKGAKRASSADAKEPGSGLQKEVKFFYDENKESPELKKLYELKCYRELDEIAKVFRESADQLKDFDSFVGKPTAEGQKKVEGALKDLDKLERKMKDAREVLAELDRAFSRTASKLSDKKNITKSLDGSLTKVKAIIYDLDEAVNPKGAGSIQARLEGAKRKLAAAAG